MKEISRIEIPLACPVLSLCWDGDELVDWAGGGRRFLLDGTRQETRVIFPYRFNRAVLSPNGKLAVLYEVLGTKGLVVRDDSLVREINRSYYHATAYEYPIALFSLPDGTQALAHCPSEYNRIEIEELESGRKLTSRVGEAADFFHSRLQVSPGGSYLLSAGWVWHPLDCVQLFSLSEVLSDPTALDRASDFEVPKPLFEIQAAAFQTDDVVLLTGEDDDAPNRTPILAGYCLSEQKTLFVSSLDAALGTMMPVGTGHVLGLYEHPKLFEIASGKVVQQWPNLVTGRQNSSIIHHVGTLPPVALDPSNKRFAVAGEMEITVVQLG